MPRSSNLLVLLVFRWVFSLKFPSEKRRLDAKIDKGRQGGGRGEGVFQKISIDVYSEWPLTSHSELGGYQPSVVIIVLNQVN